MGVNDKLDESNIENNNTHHTQQTVIFIILVSIALEYLLIDIILYLRIGANVQQHGGQNGQRLARKVSVVCSVCISLMSHIPHCANLPASVCLARDYFPSPLPSCLTCLSVFPPCAACVPSSPETTM